ncbi:MAG: hypothetical protein Q7U10_08850 [Thermodesulfovibrionia bacterium]|nr:hypothetical protein [Thermodesulfovibrionia bacterium]
MINGKAENKLSEESCIRFGSIAIAKRYITIDQLLKALNEQVINDVINKQHKLIGEILLKNGWMTEKQIELVLCELRKKD